MKFKVRVARTCRQLGWIEVDLKDADEASNRAQRAVIYSSDQINWDDTSIRREPGEQHVVFVRALEEPEGI